MAKKVGSIRDVARETGLSTATISRVMNGATNVSPQTREKVLQASKKLAYFPNPAARTLNTKKSKVIAAIIPTIEHSVYAKYIAAMEQTMAERGYSLVLAVSNADLELEMQAAEKLLGMGAEAFILSGAHHSNLLLDLFKRRLVPYVYTSIWDPDSQVPTIGYDNYELARRAVKFLIEKGHENIAVLHGPLDLSDRSVLRHEGARSAVGLGQRLEFYQSDVSVAGGKRASCHIVDEYKSCTALLCFSDVLALGAYAGLTERQISIPDDISIMGFDNLDWSEHIFPSLTTINLPAGTMGEKVASSLMDHLDMNSPIESFSLEGQIIERSSVRQLKKVITHK